MEHPLDIRAKRQKRKWFDPRYALKESSKSRAKTAGLTHTITKEDICIPAVCPVLGLTLVPGGRSDNSMSLDRVDSSKGYVPGNVQVISLRANRLKNNATLEELKALVSYMEKYSN